MIFLMRSKGMFFFGGGAKMLTNFKELVLRAQKELGVVISAREKSRMFFSFLVFLVLQIRWLSRIADCTHYTNRGNPYYPLISTNFDRVYL